METSDTKNWIAQICAGLYSGSNFFLFFLRGMIHVTQGDSGDGIYAYYSNVSKYKVVGITSYGEVCARFGRFVNMAGDAGKICEN